MKPPGPVEAAQGVDAVFHAKLLSVADAPGKGQYGIASKVFTFEVIRTFKGQLDAQVKVKTADNSAACGREYGDPGSEWLIFARTEDTGGLHDNLCSRTQSLDQAAADIAELVANADILDDEPGQPEPEPTGPGPAEPEPEPITPTAPDSPAQVDPEPTSKPGRCSVTQTSPAGGLLGFLGLGLGLAFVRRRR